MKIYGIKNCDAIKKARFLLDKSGHQHDFFDLKKIKFSHDLLKGWLTQFPDTLINKRSTTYQTIKSDWLDTDDDLEKKITIIQNNPTLIKRPGPVLIKNGDEIIIGFDKEKYLSL